jgi:hypothetical protein
MNCKLLKVSLIEFRRLCGSICGIHGKSICDHVQAELRYASIWLKSEISNKI